MSNNSKNENQKSENYQSIFNDVYQQKQELINLRRQIEATVNDLLKKQSSMPFIAKIEYTKAATSLFKTIVDTYSTYLAYLKFEKDLTDKITTDNIDEVDHDILQQYLLELCKIPPKKSRKLKTDDNDNPTDDITNN